MLQKLKTRLRNPKVVLAILSGVLLILVNLGLIGEEMSQKVTDIVNTLLSVGVAVGIFGNPDSHIKE